MSKRWRMRECVATVQAVEKAAGVEARNRRILVIDDNPAIHGLPQDLLRGYADHGVSTGL